MKPFTNTDAYTNEDVYEIVTDEFHEMKKLDLIENWVEIEDIYMNVDGDFYAVQHYHQSYFQVEGHGMNTLVESEPDMRTAVLIMTHSQVLSKMYPELFTRAFA